MVVSAVAFVLAVMATGCVRPPAPLDIAPLQPVSVAEAQAQNLAGPLVRWGGTIVSSTVEPEETCFEIVSRPLDSQARPLTTDQTDGRFWRARMAFTTRRSTPRAAK